MISGLEFSRQNKVMRKLVLASGSRYRKALLQRLGLPFEVVSPEADESPLQGEAPAVTAERLSQAKARAAGAADALVIGSDQVAECDGQRIGKPGGHEAAVRQLQLLSGKVVDFHTGVCLLDASTDRAQSRVVRCRVVFRRLNDAQIETYLRREQPYDCAGSAKAEGLGIAIIARIETDDPTSLIGLPLIALCEMLERAGVSVL
jgi:septum formation protein